MPRHSGPIALFLLLVASIAMGRGAWVENAMFDVEVSCPPPGAFDATCPQLVTQVKGKVYQMEDVVCFCVGRERVRDLIDGEETRGMCKLVRHNEYKDADGHVYGEFYDCCYGPERKRPYKAKAALGAPLTLPKGARRGAICHGESVKRDCGYALSWREFKRGDHTLAAIFMPNHAQHAVKGQEALVHGRYCPRLDKGKLTDECKEFVRGLLLLKSTPNQIFARAYLPCYTALAS